MWSCGCMMSSKLLDNARDVDSTCPNCGKVYEKRDIVSLTYTPEELDKKKKIMFYVPEKLDEKTETDQIDEAISIAVKKLKTQEEEKRKLEEEEGSVNILDALATKGSTKAVWKGMFHKEHKVESNNDLTFRNTRFGIR
jgi:basic membrane lipoprotein Med (substrate-binding protein (PBP1-ABC) superfamily)